VVEGPNVDVALHEAGDKDRAHCGQGDRRKAPEDRGEQASAIRWIERTRRRRQNRDENGKATDPDAHRRDVEDVRGNQQAARALGRGMTRERRRKRQERAKGAHHDELEAPESLRRESGGADGRRPQHGRPAPRDG
jgi:hypothetical protein